MQRSSREEMLTTLDLCMSSSQVLTQECTASCQSPVLVCDQEKDQNKILPAGWIEQPTSSLRVTRSTTELSGPYYSLLILHF